MIDEVSKDDARIVERYNYPHLDGINGFTKQALLKKCTPLYRIVGAVLVNTLTLKIELK